MYIPSGQLTPVWCNNGLDCMRPMYCLPSATYSILVWAVIAHYSNAINIRQVYGTTAIKSGCVLVEKVMMTVEVAGLKQSGRWCEPIIYYAWPNASLVHRLSLPAVLQILNHRGVRPGRLSRVVMSSEGRYTGGRCQIIIIFFFKR